MHIKDICRHVVLDILQYEIDNSIHGRHYQLALWLAMNLIICCSAGVSTL
jgi:hypothetical protein